MLVLIAGVLMISSSMNSNVAQRTSFFGMMRCIGMSKEQIIRFVRLEALNWCKTAVPTGVILGIAVTWVLCAALRFFVGEEFSDIPIFGISAIGIVSGIAVGIVTVLLAASSPAKRAAQVSPIAAISGQLENAQKPRHVVHSRIFKIETALGVHHAVSAKKNLALMAGSFALSIILFLSFLVLIDFVGYIMPQSSSDADISISSGGNANSIDGGLLDTIDGMEGIKRVFGRRSCFGVSAKFDGEQPPVNTVDIISYDELDPFNSDGLTDGKITLITSGDTFARITGETNYSLLMAQTTGDITDGEIDAISGILDENCVFHDRRDQRTAGTYAAFVLCVYGFLAVIALVSALNIVNSVSMSVSARIKQYGAMRAVGMDGRQIVKMIAAEAFTYAAADCIAGCVSGLLIRKWIYSVLITSHFSYAVWNVPVIPLLGILLFVIVRLFIGT